MSDGGAVGRLENPMNGEQRVRKVLAAMDRAGLDALIAVSGDVHGFQQPNAVMLLTGFRAIGVSFAVLRRDGELTLTVSPAWETERADGARAARVDGTDDVRAALATALAQIGPTARLGVVGLDSLGYDEARWLSQALGERSHRFDKEFLAQTRQKSAAEIRSAERATEVAVQGYVRLLELARPGVSEIDLATDICAEMADAGADDNFLMLSAARHNRAVRPPGSHTLETGDVILCEISPSVGGQFSQICRTAMVGAAPEIFVEKYALLQQSFQNGLQAAVPGARVSDLVAAINRNLVEAGYGEFCVPPHMRARGHGLGFGSIEPGDLSADSAAAIEPDMVFVIHPNQYLPETGYMMCGDPVVVTESGTRNLAAPPASFDQIE
jgi:Xaa-Pro dipeptidase